MSNFNILFLQKTVPIFNKIKFFLFLFLISVLFSSSGFAQTINGRIVDALTKEVLSNASILNIESKIGTVSNAEGKFELKTTKQSGTLEISFVGYQTKQIFFTKANQELGDIFLFSKSILGDEFIVKAQRLDDSTPMAFKTIKSDEIQKMNLGQDLPYLIQMTPSVLSSSDAGAGVGYTYVSIRGIDQARINVTVNGIPANDAESHGIWFVNMPDFSSSVETMQIQRGVGTSTNGAAAFGASINMETTALKAQPFAEISSSYGAYNTQKYSADFGTGLFKNGWAFDARLSQITSDGYIDRATSDLSSYFLNATYNGKNELLKINVFAGKEKTYQAWYGTPEALVFGNATDLQAYIDRNGWSLRPEDITNLQTAGRRYNFYTYDNETDNYQQNHYQIHYSRKFSETLNSNISLHYTKGQGFYESYKVDADFETYNINPLTINGNLIDSSDLIRREWLDNDFYGVTFSTEWKPINGTTFRIGGAANSYNGGHFGEVIWAQYSGKTPIRNRYYDNTGKKTDFSVFAKVSQELGNFVAYADVQLRSLVYRFDGFDRLPNNTIQALELRDPLVFLNPKIGLTWNLAPSDRAFVSFSVANKEATRNEYVNSVFSERPKNETLYDVEIGYQKAIQNWNIELVGYFMNYKNQLLETGAINDVGEYVRQNVAESFRSGLELSVDGYFTNQLRFRSSLSLAKNRVAEIKHYMDNYDLPYVNNLPQQNVAVFKNAPLANSPEFMANAALTYTFKSFTSEWMSRYVGTQYLDNTGSKSKSIPHFWVNDLRFNYIISASESSKISLSVLINNLFNELYAPRGYTYSFVSGGELTTENFYFPQAERNILAQIKFHF